MALVDFNFFNMHLAPLSLAFLVPPPVDSTICSGLAEASFLFDPSPPFGRHDLDTVRNASAPTSSSPWRLLFLFYEAMRRGTRLTPSQITGAVPPQRAAALHKVSSPHLAVLAAFSLLRNVLSPTPTLDSPTQHFAIILFLHLCALFPFFAFFSSRTERDITKHFFYDFGFRFSAHPPESPPTGEKRQPVFLPFLLLIPQGEQRCISFDFDRFGPDRRPLCSRFSRRYPCFSPPNVHLLIIHVFVEPFASRPLSSGTNFPSRIKIFVESEKRWSPRDLHGRFPFFIQSRQKQCLIADSVTVP